MILIPAYNLNAKLATKYEAQIAAAIHHHRAQELENLRPKKSPRLTAIPEGMRRHARAAAAAIATPAAATAAQAPQRPAQPQPRAGHGAIASERASRPTGLHTRPTGLPTAAAGHHTRPTASGEPPTLIIKAEFARYEPGKTNPTDELIVKILIAYAQSRSHNDAPGLAVSDLAHKLNISRQAINAALARLQRKKLVKAIPVKDIPYSQRQNYGTSLKAVWVVMTR